VSNERQSLAGWQYLMNSNVLNSEALVCNIREVAYERGGALPHNQLGPHLVGVQFGMSGETEEL